MRPLVDGLRTLFRRGSRIPQVAITVAVANLEPDAEVEPGVLPEPADRESRDANVPRTPDSGYASRQSSIDGGSSPDSQPWDAVPLAPVPLCQRMRDPCTAEPRACERCHEVHGPSGVPRYWCTQWGKRYHQDFNCYGLRDAHRKFPLRCLADWPELTPCKLCANP